MNTLHVQDEWEERDTPPAQDAPQAEQTPAERPEAPSGFEAMSDE